MILGDTWWGFFLAKCHTYKTDNQGIARLVILGDTSFLSFYEEKQQPHVQVSVGRIHEVKRVMPEWHDEFHHRILPVHELNLGTDCDWYIFVAK